MITGEDIKRLLSRAEGQAVLSLSLHVDNAARENQADPPAWRIWLKRTLRELGNGAGDDHWLSLQERAAAYFEYYHPTSKGIVAFFGADWEQVFPLPVPVENRGGFGDLMVGPLLRILNEYKPYLVVQVSREEAHFYISFLGQAEFHDSLEIDLDEYDFAQKTLMPATAAIGAGGHGGLTQGSNRDSFEDMIEAHRTRFYRDVVDYTRQLTRARNIQRIIVGGGEQAAHAVHNLMPDGLRKHVLEVVSLPGHYTAQEIMAQVQPQALAHEQALACARVSEVIDMARAGGRAVLGPEAARYALERQKVETLLLSWGLPDQTLVNELTRSALNASSKVEIMYGAAAQKLQDEGGGVAAILYYPM